MEKNGFTSKEKKQFRMKKYLKEHAFEFVVHFVINIIFVGVIVYLCGGTRYDIAFALAIVYSAVRVLYDVHIYKKEWLDVDIKDDKE